MLWHRGALSVFIITRRRLTTITAAKRRPWTSVGHPSSTHQPTIPPPPMDHLALVLACLLPVALFPLWRRLFSHKPLPLPPGPKPWPVIGNFLDFPPTNPWRTYAQWSKTYGPFLSSC